MTEAETVVVEQHIETMKTYVESAGGAPPQISSHRFRFGAGDWTCVVGEFEGGGRMVTVAKWRDRHRRGVGSDGVDRMTSPSGVRRTGNRRLPPWSSQWLRGRLPGGLLEFHHGGAVAERLRDRPIGTWKLVSYVEHTVDGSEPFESLGHKPGGIIMYTPEGYMSVQLSRPNRPWRRAELK